MHRAGSRLCSSSKCLRHDASRSLTQHRGSLTTVKVDHTPLKVAIPTEHFTSKRARKAIKNLQESLDESDKNSSSVIRTLGKAGKTKKYEGML